MGQSAGTGSPIWFLCPNYRRARNRAWSSRWRRYQYVVPAHEVELTGRTRPYRAHGHALGVRSTRTSREYRCRTCGLVGWSNHVDLARLAGDPVR